MERIKFIDKLLTDGLFIYLIVHFFFHCLQQSILKSPTPIFIVLIPVFYEIIIFIRLLFLYKYKVRTNITFYNFWRAFLFYFIISLYVSYVFYDINHQYSTYLYTLFYPLTFIYLLKLFYISPIICRKIVNVAPLLLLILSGIYLYFIPLSLTDKGNFGSLNTSYYILLFYPLTLLNKKSIVKIMSTIITIVVVLLSMKRGGIIALVLGFSVYFILKGLVGKGNLFKTLIYLFLMFFCLVFSFGYIDDLSGGYMSSRLLNTIGNAENESRAYIYTNVINHLQSSSVLELIFGHGPDTVRLLTVDNYTAHNDFLEFFYDYGLIGLFFLLFIHFSFIKLIFKILKKNPDSIIMFPAVFLYTVVFILSLISHVYIMGYFLVIILVWTVLLNYRKL